MLFHSSHLLGGLIEGKFLILRSTYPQRLSAPEENAEFNHQGCDRFPTIFHASKNLTFL
jgi:hypothetical protein